MKKLYAAVYPNGDFAFNSIAFNSDKVQINPSDYKYGNVRVRTVNVKKFTEQLPIFNSDHELWDNHKIAWVWVNPDGTFWWDTLSLNKEDTRKWSSKPEIMIGLGFKIIPVQFTATTIAHLMAA